MLAGQDSYVDLLTNHLRKQSGCDSDYLRLLLDLYPCLAKAPEAEEVLVKSGALNVIFDHAHAVAALIP